MTLARAICLICGMLAATAFLSLGHDAVAEEAIRTATNTLTGMIATLLGFMVSAGALLYAVINTRLVRNLQRTGHFSVLLSDMFVCATALFICLGVVTACLFLPKVDRLFGGFSLVELGAAFVLFCCVSSCALLAPVGHKMWLLLSSISPENPERME